MASEYDYKLALIMSSKSVAFNLASCMQLRVADQVVRHARPRIEHVPQTRLASGSLALQSEKQELNNKYKIKKIVEYS